MLLLEQNLRMKITICECKYFEKCVSTDRNVLLYENIQMITIQKVFTSGKNQKAYGSNILADQICREMSRCDWCRVIQVIQSYTRLRLFDALKSSILDHTQR